VYDDLDHITGIPECIGRGSNRNIELSLGLSLNFYDCEYQQDLIVNAPIHEHDIQIVILLSGFIYFEAVHPNLGGACAYFSGSGISPAYVEKYKGGERLTFVGVNIRPPARIIEHVPVRSSANQQSNLNASQTGFYDCDSVPKRCEKF
jgi:hypothetical protein